MEKKDSNEPKSLAYRFGEFIGCLIVLAMGLAIILVLIMALTKVFKWFWFIFLASIIT